MILAYAVILGCAVAWVRHRGHMLDHIASIALRSAWLVLVALVLQIPLLRAVTGPTQQVRLQQVLFLSSHLLLLAFVWRNRRHIGIQIFGLGVLCNLTVILANGGFMPITPETLVQINPGSTVENWTLGFHYGGSKDVILSGGDARFRFLSDMLVLPPPFPWPVAFSVGDLLIAVGIVHLLQAPLRATEVDSSEAHAKQ